MTFVLTFSQRNRSGDDPSSSCCWVSHRQARTHKHTNRQTITNANPPTPLLPPTPRTTSSPSCAPAACRWPSTCHCASCCQWTAPLTTTLSGPRPSTCRWSTSTWPCWPSGQSTTLSGRLVSNTQLLALWASLHAGNIVEQKKKYIPRAGNRRTVNILEASYS